MEHYHASSERVQNLRIKSPAKKMQKQAIEALRPQVVGFDKNMMLRVLFKMLLFFFTITHIVFWEPSTFCENDSKLLVCWQLIKKKRGRVN